MAGKKMKKRKKITLFDIVVFLIVTLCVVLVIVPFWNAIVISVSTNEAYIADRFSLWPAEFTLDNYTAILTRGKGLITAYKNTIFVAGVGTLAGMVVMTFAAYVFSRKFPGRRFIFMISIFSMYFGGGVVPTYLNLKNLGLINSYGGVILLTLVSVNHTILIMKGFEGVPKELEEAAKIDGANDWKIFTTVMLPLNKPILATISLFTLVDLWNDWYWPMLILTDNNKLLLQVYVRNIIKAADTMTTGLATSISSAANVSFSMGIQMATILVVILPIMCVYPFVQKYFVKGIYVGSVKM